MNHEKLAVILAGLLAFPAIDLVAAMTSVTTTKETLGCTSLERMIELNRAAFGFGPKKFLVLDAEARRSSDCRVLKADATVVLEGRIVDGFACIKTITDNQCYWHVTNDLSGL